MNYQEIKNLLSTVEVKNTMLHAKYPNTISHDTIYEASGVLKNGKAIDVEEFNAKYANYYNAKIASLKELVSDDYINIRAENLRKHLINTLNAIGGNEKQIANLKRINIKTFIDRYYKGDYDDIIDSYEGIGYTTILDTLSNRRTNQGDLL